MVAEFTGSARSDHSLFGSRFVKERMFPFRHLGKVFDDGVTAVKAYDEFTSSYGSIEVELQPLYTAPDSDTLIELEDKAAITQNNKVLDIVSKDYSIVNPSDFIATWDKSVGVPVEAIGLTGGNTLLIASRVDDAVFDVEGDIVTYIIGKSPMIGDSAVSIQIVPMRLVCWNGLVTEMGRYDYTIKHDRMIRDELDDWMSYAIVAARDGIPELNNAFTMMADYKVTPEDLDNILKYTYPIRRKPSANGPDDIVQRRIARWSNDRELTIRQREWANQNFVDQVGEGMERDVCNGTAYGLYQAITEVEDWRPGRGTNARANAERASDTLLGVRAQSKERAFTKCLEVSNFSLN